MPDARQFRSLKSLLTTPASREAAPRPTGAVALAGPTEAERAALQATEVARAAQRRAEEEALARQAADVRAAAEAEASRAASVVEADDEPEDAGDDTPAEPGSIDADPLYGGEAEDDGNDAIAEYRDVDPEPPTAPPAPEIVDAPAPEPPPRARFADVVVYDGSLDPVRDAVAAVISEGLNELARLRARAAEAFETQVETMLAEVVQTVLARELALAPADVAEIVRRSLADFQASGPVRVRVSPEEAESLSAVVPVVADDALFVGDVVVDVADGSLDLRLGTRISAVLRAQMVHL